MLFSFSAKTLTSCFVKKKKINVLKGIIAMPFSLLARFFGMMCSKVSSPDLNQTTSELKSLFLEAAICRLSQKVGLLFEEALLASVGNNAIRV